MGKLLQRSGKDGAQNAPHLPVRLGQGLFVVLFAACIVAIITLVDLTPQVERTLFFSNDDPQLEADEQISEMFPGPAQIIVSARSEDELSEAYVERIGALSADLQAIDGVGSVLDILHGPDDLDEAFGNPLWQRLLVPEDGESTNLIVLLDTDAFDRVVPALEEVVEAHAAPGFELAVSGEPYVVEKLREMVIRDFQLFGAGALILFTVAMILLFKSFWIVLGATVAAGTATALTLLTRPLLGLQVDLLTPNITTIVFVLTLLHIVFLTNNWQKVVEDHDRVRNAIRWTRTASFWAMATTALGFLSLLLAPAAPARNFGISCAVGSALAFLSAYLIFPAFLRSADPARKAWPGLDRPSGPLERLHGKWAIAVVVLALAAIPGLFRLDMDPQLFEYFRAGSEIREGLERVDRSGGSSPLELVIRDAEGQELSEGEVYDRMWGLQQALEEDSDTGTVLSLPVLMAEAEEQTFWSFILSWNFMLDRMEDSEHSQVAASFVTEDRSAGRFLLRMKESARGEQTRTEVIDRLEQTVRDHGFQPVLTGGLYPLQAKMTELVSSSLLTGLLGLTALFVVIAFVVARSVAVAAAMIAGFVMIPLFLLALFGYLRVPLDVIALPAANIAMAIGVDNLIHLVHHRRRKEREEREEGEGRERTGRGAGAEEEEGTEAASGRMSRDGEATLWIEARTDLLRPILGSSLIVVLGFGLLLLSSLPSSRRLGLAVVAGSVAAAGVVLVVFPSIAVFLQARRRPTSQAEA